MVARRLARRVGAVGLVAVGFAERRFFPGQRAVDFVGRDVQKRKRLSVASSGSRLQYSRTASSRWKVPTILVWMKSSGPWIERSTCDSAAKLMIARGWCGRQQAARQVAVADVAVHEEVPRVTGQRGEVFAIAGIGQLVEVDQASSLCASQSRTKLAPMKPAPPVTRIMGKDLSHRFGRKRQTFNRRGEAGQAHRFLTRAAQRP
jgi:hypothetical protein